MITENALDRVAIESLIYEIRGQKVMLDFDLAKMYKVETKRLKEAVRRNLKRFEGDDFMFELTINEYNSLIINMRTQFASSNGKGGRRHMPFAFTEQGVAMLSSVLRSEEAILVNRAIIRTFVAMRNYIMSTAAISAELELLERNDEDNLEAINDLSEDMRQEIDTIYQAIAAALICGFDCTDVKMLDYRIKHAYRVVFRNKITDAVRKKKIIVLSIRFIYYLCHVSRS